MSRWQTASAVNVTVLLLTLVAAAQPFGSPDPGLPDDPTLDPVRPALEKIVADVTRNGLSAHPIVDKVKEGLAKGVAATAIRDAVGKLSQRLLGARRFLEENRAPEPPFPLVWALAVAGDMGVDAAALTPLVSVDVPEASAVRAVDAVRDLTVRGYPARPAVTLVRLVVEREPPAIGRVLAGLEAIRNQTGRPQAAALDLLLGRLAADHDSFETLVTRTLAPAPPTTTPSTKTKAPTRPARPRARRHHE